MTYTPQDPEDWLHRWLPPDPSWQKPGAFQTWKAIAKMIGAGLALYATVAIVIIGIVLTVGVLTRHKASKPQQATTDLHP